MGKSRRAAIVDHDEDEDEDDKEDVKTSFFDRISNIPRLILQVRVSFLFIYPMKCKLSVYIRIYESLFETCHPEY